MARCRSPLAIARCREDFPTATLNLDPKPKPAALPNDLIYPEAKPTPAAGTPDDLVPVDPNATR